MVGARSGFLSGPQESAIGLIGDPGTGKSALLHRVGVEARSVGNSNRPDIFQLLVDTTSRQATRATGTANPSTAGTSSTAEAVVNPPQHETLGG